MTRLRIPVAGLMALVLYAAVGFAAVKSPTPAWASGMLTMTLGLLLLATLGGVYGRPAVRPFWGGFAIVGWTYLALATVPWVGPHLATTRLADEMYSRLEYVPRRSGETAWAVVGPRVREGTVQVMDHPAGGTGYMLTYEDEGGLGDRSIWVPPPDLRPIDEARHRLLYHALICPVLACLGGLAARHFAARESDRGQEDEQ